MILIHARDKITFDQYHIEEPNIILMIATKLKGIDNCQCMIVNFPNCERK